MSLANVLFGGRTPADDAGNVSGDKMPLDRVFEARDDEESLVAEDGSLCPIRHRFHSLISHFLV